jgi:hypothetical protein
MCHLGTPEQLNVLADHRATVASCMCHHGTPEQLNVLADHRATVVLQDLRVAGQPTEFARRGYLRDDILYISSREQRTFRISSVPTKTQQSDRTDL